jgi:type I restriction enzyme R subunit
MQETRDHAQLNAFLDPAVERFRQKEEETQEIFKKDLISYLRLYSFLAQIMPFQDSDLEKLYAYGRFLLLKLPKRTTERYAFGDEVALKYYRLQKTMEGSISLIAHEGGIVYGADALFLEQVKEDAIANEELMKVAHANNDINNFGLVFKKVLEGFFVDRMDQNQEIFEKFMENTEFQKLVTDYLMKQVYEGIRLKEKI